jgi:ribosomal 50S subunit-recycling heat shock protein
LPSNSGNAKKERKPMRLDKFLKVSRLIKRRTVASEACDRGLVRVNGKQAKASCKLSVGDIIQISIGTRTIRVEVLEISETVRKEEAAALYRELPPDQENA